MSQPNRGSRSTAIDRVSTPGLGTATATETVARNESPPRDENDAGDKRDRGRRVRDWDAELARDNPLAGVLLAEIRKMIRRSKFRDGDGFAWIRDDEGNVIDLAAHLGVIVGLPPPRVRWALTELVRKGYVAREGDLFGCKVSPNRELSDSPKALRRRCQRAVSKLRSGDILTTDDQPRGDKLSGSNVASSVVQMSPIDRGSDPIGREVTPPARDLRSRAGAIARSSSSSSSSDLKKKIGDHPEIARARGSAPMRLREIWERAREHLRVLERGYIEAIEPLLAKPDPRSVLEIRDLLLKRLADAIERDPTRARAEWPLELLGHAKVSSWFHRIEVQLNRLEYVLQSESRLGPFEAGARDHELPEAPKRATSGPARPPTVESVPGVSEVLERLKARSRGSEGA